MSSTSKFSPMPTKPRARPVERDFVGKSAKPPCPKTLRFRTGQGTVSKCGKLSQKSTQCPQIAVLTLILGQSRVEHIRGQSRSSFPDAATEQKIPVWPRHTGRSPVPPEVPDEFKRDYQEACLVLADSSNASAALSRRCLQFILREKLGAQGKDLYNEIDWTITSGNLPSSIIELLDVPRKIGNRAAHPTLSDAGMIVDVEPWEAEWCLEVIEALYDHIFVIPARNRERLERLGRALKSGADG